VSGMKSFQSVEAQDECQQELAKGKASRSPSLG
jgi:hypothetical protein